jgi:hypothetical protein
LAFFLFYNLYLLTFVIIIYIFIESKKVNTMKKDISPILKQMKVGDTEAYPIERMLVLKSTATLLSQQMGRSFKTSVVRNKNIILVTRTV